MLKTGFSIIFILLFLFLPLSLIYPQTEDSIKTDTPQKFYYFNQIPLDRFNIYSDYSSPFALPQYSYIDVYYPGADEFNTPLALLPMNTEFLKPLRDMYERSRPTGFQKFLGMVNFAGAVALAGYHIYKYEIKKEKK